MLESWRLKDFKSFSGDNELSLRPITVFCGANSSGKSSIVQSMLLIKQTFQHASSTRAVALNGPLVRLGTFSDVENFHSRTAKGDHSVSIGWTISDESSGASSSILPSEELVSLSTDFSFDTAGPKAEKANLEIQPSLSSVRLAMLSTDQDDVSHQHNIHVKRSSGRGRRPKYDRLATTALIDVGGYIVAEADSELKARASERFAKGEVVAASLRYFLPYDLLVRYDSALMTARAVTQALVDGRLRRRSALNIVPANTMDVVRSAWDSAEVSTEYQGPPALGEFGSEFPLDAYVRAMSSLRFAQKRNIRARLAELQSQIEATLLREIPAEKVVTLSSLDLLRDSYQLNDNYFRFRLNYVGPLRDEPKPMYALQSLQSPTDVGPKGELTAAILHLNARRQVSYLASSNFHADRILKAPVRSTLQEALVDWMRYLGIADAVDTTEKGKLGHELRIKTSSSTDYQDLTNVGIGVSQVLPVLVTCLLAPSDSTLLFEQPELHLHPKVQARLADFFISMSMLGKQCIVETHGEHLVDRIRFRIACDESDDLQNNVGLFFFSQLEGRTNVSRVNVTRYGAIPDWPDDFFDQSQKEAARIVEKALERRVAEASRRSET